LEGELSRSFDENTGSDDMMAIAPSQQFVSFCGGGGGHSTFCGGVFLNPPFFYNPTKGNLLVDFRIFQGGPAPPFFPPGGARLDAFDQFGDGVSSVFAYGVGVELPTVGAATSLGLATEFVFLPIPRLTIDRVSGGVRLRWYYRPGGYVLQTSTGIGSDAIWQLVGGIVTEGTYKEVILPFDSPISSRFFRLALTSVSPNVADQLAGKPN
jgi:hypothetical protein